LAEFEWELILVQTFRQTGQYVFAVFALYFTLKQGAFGIAGRI
jgi:hypothetical protein